MSTTQAEIEFRSTDSWPAASKKPRLTSSVASSRHVSSGGGASFGGTTAGILDRATSVPRSFSLPNRSFTTSVSSVGATAELPAALAKDLDTTDQVCHLGSLSVFYDRLATTCAQVLWKP